MSRGPLADDAASRSAGGDPLFLHARRELIFTLGAWLVFGLWVVGYSWLMGSLPETPPENIATVLGMPAWVFWGIGFPWILANVLTFWYCFRFMVDDDLDEVEEESGGGHPDPATGSGKGNP